MKKMNLFHPHPDIPVNPITDLSNGVPHDIRWGTKSGAAVLLQGLDSISTVDFKCHRLKLQEVLRGHPCGINYITLPIIDFATEPHDGLILLRGPEDPGVGDYSVNVISERSHYHVSLIVHGPCLVLQYVYNRHEVSTLSEDAVKFVQRWFGSTLPVIGRNYDDYEPELDLEIAQTIVGLKNFFEIP